MVLLERSNYDSPRIGEHLAPDAVPLLSSLGLDDLLSDPRHIRSSCVTSAWGSPELNANEYIRSPYGNGFNLSRPAFDEFFATVAAREGVRVLRRSSVIDHRLEGTRWEITYARDSQLQSICADFLVDASGRTSTLGRSLGGQRMNVDRLIGIAAFCQMHRPNPDHSVHIEAQPDGWWYLTALAGNRVVAMFMTDSDLFQSAGEPPDNFWSRMLAKTRLVKSIVRDGQIIDCVVRSAHSGRLVPVCGPGWLAVGDASVSFDPLSSMGISKGLDQGIRAAAAIHAYLDGRPQHLDEYRQDSQLAFDKYLLIRARYYRAENRWPEAEFWKRRRQPLPNEVPLTLDPAIIVTSRNGALPRDRRTSMLGAIPTFDVALLVELASNPLTAHQLVARFKAECKQPYSDREIIVAVQTLLNDGVLSQEKTAMS